jgi:DNA-binding response OmpR family regulator/Tfp pilus assembly protein PilF
LALSSHISEKWVLVIDDIEGVREQLNMSLSSSGFAKLHVVGSIHDALVRMETNRYDVILCDYLLGEGTDGQQFLKYLRTNDLITRNTIFIMMTAEQAFEKIMAASEVAPDDYMLKPFTAAQFNARLEKLFEKQEYFAAIDKASDSKNPGRVIAECNRRLVNKDKYFVDLCKIKAAALLRDGRCQEAVGIYREILLLRPVSWAKLGLARALFMLNQNVDAEVLVREILAESPQFMGAYDLLSQLLVSSGAKQEALDVLQKAREVVPSAMSRVREISKLAVSTGNHELAEQIMSEALQKHRFSPVREANDYVVLSSALMGQGKTKEALSVVTDAQKSFDDEHSVVALAVSESDVHRVAGNTEKAEIAINKALSQGDVTKLPTHLVMSLADACLALGKEDHGTYLLRHVVQNNPEDAAVKNKVHEILIAAGQDASQATAMIEESNRAVILLNNEGVQKAESGQLAEAIEMLTQAASRLPNNMQIISNAALVLALDLVRNGTKPERLSQCLHYRGELIKKVPTHSKLAQIDELLKQLKK